MCCQQLCSMPQSWQCDALLMSHWTEIPPDGSCLWARMLVRIARSWCSVVFPIHRSVGTVKKTVLFLQTIFCSRIQLQTRSIVKMVSCVRLDDEVSSIATSNRIVTISGISCCSNLFELSKIESAEFVCVEGTVVFTARKL